MNMMIIYISLPNLVKISIKGIKKRNQPLGELIFKNREL